jgi:hypothetical protein
MDEVNMFTIITTPRMKNNKDIQIDKEPLSPNSNTRPNFVPKLELSDEK